MKLYLVMPKALKPHFRRELESYKKAYIDGDLQTAWKHLENAHILGQRYPMEHNYVHWKMLLFGIRIKDRKEVLGQLPRLIFGGVKSFVGTVPIGNPGGANVPPMKSYPIHPDLQKIFDTI